MADPFSATAPMGDFFRVWKTEDVLKRILPPILVAFAAGYILGRFRILYLLTG